MGNNGKVLSYACSEGLNPFHLSLQYSNTVLMMSEGTSGCKNKGEEALVAVEEEEAMHMFLKCFLTSEGICLFDNPK